MKKYRFEAILFVVDAICMILELIASRVISPYFGNSNVVWTSVIGIILLSGSIGNYFGGIIADKDYTDKKLKVILFLSAIYVFIIPLIQEYVLIGITNITSNIKIGAILATIMLFFIPSVLMGLITPIIVKLKLESLTTAGKVSGKINAIATIGGISGTFLGGFFLIPNFGSVQLLFGLAIVLLVLIPLVDFKLKSKSTLFITIMIIISIIFMNFFIVENNKNGEAVLNGNTNKYVSYDTQYGRVLIYNGKRDNKNVRILNIDSGYESATYTDENEINELVFEYTKYYDLMFKSSNEIQNTLLIGGAGYSYPKYYISHYENKNMDVVEIDGEITELAKKYFYLDKLIKDYNLEENKRLNLITEDGRTYLNNNTKKYDAILNDAFSGSSPAKTLTTMEAAQNIKKSLNENGIYLTNVISSLEGENSKF
ncbi:MAG: fused MFS/spermidine synthase [Clostridia bacterium]|nr:fused MFS/spermidine synthase [Clostridia bacterium]